MTKRTSKRTFETRGPKAFNRPKTPQAERTVVQQGQKENETVVASEASSILASPNEGRDAAVVGVTRNPPDPTVEGESPRKGQNLW